MSDEKAPEEKQDHQPPRGTDTEGRWPGPAGPVEYAAHADWLVRNLPIAELWLRPRDGHISVLDGCPVAMDWLLELARVAPGAC